MIRLDGALREMFHLLGRVRDLDLSIAAACEFHPDTRIEIQERLLQMRTQAKATVRTRLAEHCVFDDLRFSDDFIDKEASMRESAAIQHAHHQAIRSLAKVRHRWSVMEVHQLRRRAKRLRYSIDFFESTYGEEAVRYGNRLKKLQDRLGKVMDLVTLERIFSSLSDLSRDANEECQRRVRKIGKSLRKKRDAVLRSNRRLSGSEWKRLQERMETEPSH